MTIEDTHLEWTLMYRKGIPFGKITELCHAPRSSVHYHLQGRILRDPSLRADYERNGPKPRQHKVSPRYRARFDALTLFVSEHGRLPIMAGSMEGEQSLATWLSVNRRRYRDGSLRPDALELLNQIPEWNVPARTTKDKERWNQRLTDLQAFIRTEGRWPRYRAYKSEDERLLGVWLHSQKQKHANGLMPDDQIQALTEQAPGWDGVLRMPKT